MIIDEHPTPDADAAPRAAAQDGRAAPRVRRIGWAALGLACVALGTIGIVVPGLPTTVFFISAAACFSRSSPRLEAWVLSLPRVGPAIRDHRAGLGMPMKAKVLAIGMIVAMVGLSALVISGWVVRLVVVAVGLIGVAVIARQPTRMLEN